MFFTPASSGNNYSSHRVIIDLTGNGLLFYAGRGFPMGLIRFYVYFG